MAMMLMMTIKLLLLVTFTTPLPAVNGAKKIIERSQIDNSGDIVDRSQIEKSPLKIKNSEKKKKISFKYELKVSRNHFMISQKYSVPSVKCVSPVLYISLMCYSRTVHSKHHLFSKHAHSKKFFLKKGGSLDNFSFSKADITLKKQSVKLIEFSSKIK